ncbi:MAG: tetratricopeptide repeat protein, partial [Chrysiogenetes bacterium]|nr:tetratricopeptide repeat protein [Chrysiogenetes bacterium]
MTKHDPRGMALTAAGTAAAGAYETALQDYLHYRGDPLAAVEAALAHDPAMPMARVLKAYLLLLATEARTM